MKKLLKLCAIALSITLTIVAAHPAQAAQQGRIYKDQSGAIFIYGLQPGQTIETGRDFAPARFITSNACGLLIVRRSKTQPVGRIRVEGQIHNDASLPTQLIPPCKDGQLAEPRSQPFKTAVGDVIIPLAPNRRYQVSMLDRRSLRAIKANACGFVRMPSDSLGEKPLLPTTSGTVARFAITDLPTGEQILCQRRQFYRPGSFPPPLAVAMSNQTIVDVEGTAGSGGTAGGGQTTPPQNTPPTISGIPDRIELRGNSSTISFSVSDPNAIVSVRSLNPSAIQSAVLGGSGANRTLTITPVSGYQGSASIEITATSGGATSSKFMLVSLESGVSLAFCRTPNGFRADTLSPNRSYILGFDDWSDSYSGIANSSGAVDFVVNPVPDNEWSDGDRNIYVFNQNYDIVRQAPLPTVSNC